MFNFVAMKDFIVKMVPVKGKQLANDITFFKKRWSSIQQELKLAVSGAAQTSSNIHAAAAPIR